MRNNFFSLVCRRIILVRFAVLNLVPFSAPLSRIGFAVLLLAPFSTLLNTTAHAQTLVVDQTSLTFTHDLLNNLDFDAGRVEEDPAPQSLAVSVSGGPQLNFAVTTSVTTPEGINWLSVTPSSGTTPSMLIVSVSAIGFAPVQFEPDFYTGTITLTTEESSTQTVEVEVSLIVRGVRRLSASLDVLQFDGIVGSDVPSQAITLFTVGGHGTGPLLFTTSVITQDGGDWLTVSLPWSGVPSPSSPITVTLAGPVPPGNAA